MTASLPVTGIPSDALKGMMDQVRNTRTSRTCELALVSLYLYDYVTTLDQEVELMWFKPMSFMKVLFFLNRYLPIAAGCINASIYLNTSPTTLTSSLCDHWFKFQGGEAIVTLGIIQVIRVTRVWAVYNSTPLLITLGVFGGLQLAASSTIMGMSITRGVVTSQPERGFFVCDITTPPYFAAYWIPILTFEFTLFLLIVIKGFQNFRQSRVFSVSGISGRGLLNIMIRDSVICFLITAVIYVAIAAVWYWTDPSLHQSLSMAGIMVPPMVATKMLFKLRQSFYEETTKSTIGHESRFDSLPSSSWNQQTRQILSLREDRGQREEWGGVQQADSA